MVGLKYQTHTIMKKTSFLETGDLTQDYNASFCAFVFVLFCFVWITCKATGLMAKTLQVKSDPCISNDFGNISPCFSAEYCIYLSTSVCCVLGHFEFISRCLQCAWPHLPSSASCNVSTSLKVTMALTFSYYFAKGYIPKVKKSNKVCHISFILILSWLMQKNISSSKLGLPCCLCIFSWSVIKYFSYQFVNFLFC